MAIMIFRFYKKVILFLEILIFDLLSKPR